MSFLDQDQTRQTGWVLPGFSPSHDHSSGPMMLSPTVLCNLLQTLRMACKNNTVFFLSTADVLSTISVSDCEYLVSLTCIDTSTHLALLGIGFIYIYIAKLIADVKPSYAPALHGYT